MASITVLSSVGWPVVDRFRVGNTFAISPHGLFIAIGFMVGAWLFGRIAPARGVSERAISSIVLWSLIGAIVGARFFYVLAHWSEFSPQPLEALLIWKGGISLLGGIAGATIANAINIRRFGLRFFQIADALAAPLALGIAVGRIGDLIIGDHLGKPTSWFLAWRYSGGTVAPPFSCVQEFCQAPLQGDRLQTLGRTGSELLDRTGTVISAGVGVHQTALYDMLLAWGLFALLWWFVKQPRREGLAALLFAIYYGCCRLLEDFLRIDKRFGPLTGSQWTALTVVLISVTIWAYLAVSKRPGPTTPPRPNIRRRWRDDPATVTPAPAG
ncbi:MAG: prolipoprotein diacylglyceryl transferase family protein [Actinomycetota bacterium]